MSYKVDYRKALNDRQLEAVMHHEGPCLVIAGAGTGKTTTLVHRVSRLIEDGVKPGSILLLTFTKKAAENMIQKCSGMLDERCQLITARTFHGFALSELKKYNEHTGYGKDFTIIEPDDCDEIIKIVKEELEINELVSKYLRSSVLRAIQSRSTTKLISVREVISTYYSKYNDHSLLIEMILKRFRELKKEKKVMDFDDLLKTFFELLTNNETVWNWVRGKYQYIMIDEYQDTDRLQAALMKHIAGSNGNIMVVGDDAQSIYAFRGANVKNILSFPDEFPNCLVIKIEENHRSTKPILDLSNAVMVNARERFEKELFTKKIGENKPVLFRVRDNHHESICVADLIAEHLKRGCKLNDIAVLFRNGRFSNDLELELNRRSIPFKKFGGLEFGKQAHIKDILAFVKVGINTEDILSWNRILKLFPGIGKKKSVKITKRIVNESLAILRGMGLADLYDLIMAIKSISKNPAGQLKLISEFYKPICEDEHNEKMKNYDQEIKTLMDNASQHYSAVDFINSFALNSVETEKEGEGNSGEYITLSTIHSAKGLEWDTVFVLCVNDECMPYIPEQMTQQRIDEEVRLFHVALTRAKNSLYLFAPKYQAHSRSKGGDISPFLQTEIISKHLEMVDISECKYSGRYVA